MPTCNGKDLLSAVIQEPRIGVWTAVIDVDSDEAISGKVTIEIDGVTWIGTVQRGDLYAGRVHAQIVGGAGKLGVDLGAKYYLGIPLAIALGDLMIGTGETLSTTTAADVRNHSVARWTRPQGRAGLALRQISDEILGTSWRVLRDGTVWLGPESWSEVKPTYDETDQAPGRDSMTIAPESPIVAPGTTFLGKRVSRVTTTLAPGGLRQELLFESADAPGNRVMSDISAVVESLVGNRIDYSRLYPAKVVKQASDGSLELLADDARMRGNGITRVPIRHGIPGCVVTVPPGGKVQLFFEGGDPKRPAAALWPDGSSVTKIEITTGTLKVFGDLEVTGEITAKSDTLPVKVSTHQHPSAMGPTGSPTPGT